MAANKQFIDFIIQVQSISKIGKLYSKDEYALRNYEELEVLSKQMLENFLQVQYDRPNYFKRDIYPTPNVSVRTVVFNKQKQILLVKEKNQEGYSLPGGWCDLFDSAAENAKRECFEEAGVDIKITRLIGINDRTPYLKRDETPSYTIVFEAQLVKDHQHHDFEISEVKFFDIDNLPKFSTKNTTEENIRFINAALKGESFYD